MSQHESGVGTGLRVLVASDVRLYRDGLVWSLAASARLRVEGSADSGPAAMARLADSGLNVLLVDMSMEGAIKLIHAVSVSYPDVHIVAYTVGLDDQSVLRCIEAGAKGYVNRDATVDELVATVESVARGESPCSPRMAASLFRRVAALAQSDQGAGGTPTLTQREQQIVELLDRGLSNKEIATQLGIELATAKNHVHHILEKLQVRRRSQVRGSLGWRHRTGPPLQME